VGAGFSIGARDFVDGGENFSQKITVPDRAPDFVAEETVSATQARPILLMKKVTE
jgi:hypothetical protein